MADHLFAIHDPGGENLIVEAGKTGWVVFAEKVGDDPSDRGGKDFNTRPGISAICRLAFGWYGEGNVPDSSRYERFAQRCANYVAASKGCKRWIIGNEMNLTAERAILPNGQGEVLTPTMYARCFNLVRDKIKAVQPDAEVIIGGVAPWNNQTAYPGNEAGDWVKYYADTLNAIGAGRVDGIAIHTYTHGRQTDKVYSDEKMGAPFNNRFYNFRSFEDFLNGTPTQFKNLPVYITEFDADTDLWGENNGLIQAAYGAIDHWNNQPGNQRVLCLALYRWEKHDKWALCDKGGSIDDFKKALQSDHRHNWQYKAPAVLGSGPVAPVRPDLSPNAKTVTVTADNGLNLRSTPSTSGGIVTLLPKGSVLEVLMDTAVWIEVRFEDQTGFVHREYVA